METLDSLRRKLEVTGDLKEVVKTMKTLAAVSIHQYEKAVASLGYYRRTVEMGLQIVIRSNQGEVPRAAQPAPRGRLGAVIFGSELGMCGQFNDLLVNYALEQCQQLQGKKAGLAIMAVGARAVSLLEEAGEKVEFYFDVPGSISGITPRVQEMLLQIETWQCPGGVQRIVLFHHKLVSGAAYHPQTVPLLPLDLAWLETLGQRPWPSQVLPTYTMDRAPLLYALLGQHLFVSLYQALAESLASENAARLAAMQAAENNINDRLQDLRLQYNQLRHSTITEELLDIVAGFEALTGKNH
jgi:F-type H+-transporting ATPase subunit gamma